MFKIKIQFSYLIPICFALLALYSCKNDDGARKTASTQRSLAHGSRSNLELLSNETAEQGTNAVQESVNELSLATDKDKLIAFYTATGGDTWTTSTNWKSDSPLSAWYGVTSNAEGGVIGLNLAANNLKGPINSLAALTSLQSVDLSNNKLTGTIEAIKSLTKLQALNLNGNSIYVYKTAKFGPAQYNINGTVKIYDDGSGAIKLEFNADWGTVGGPDPYIYLDNVPGAHGTIPAFAVFNLKSIPELNDRVRSVYTYTLPSSVTSIDDYQYPIVYCKRYTALFANSEFKYFFE